ncbi:unnamed protein product [Larinioides sclopetarius]|uniref:Uncharacterized protein n=1 Tax=Larinioides sclopetarius TaxID=280406 RepID=A0AAV2BJ58_9ARAC
MPRYAIYGEICFDEDPMGLTKHKTARFHAEITLIDDLKPVKRFDPIDPLLDDIFDFPLDMPPPKSRGKRSGGYSSSSRKATPSEVSPSNKRKRKRSKSSSSKKSAPKKRKSSAPRKKGSPKKASLDKKKETKKK